MMQQPQNCRCHMSGHAHGARRLRERDWRSVLLLTTILSCLLLLGVRVQAAQAPYSSYTFDYWRDVVPAPQAFLPEMVLTGIDMGVGKLRQPEDLFVYDDTIYVADSGNNRIVILDSDFRVKGIISKLNNAGTAQSFANPTGLFVASPDRIFVADKQNSRVIVVNAEGDILQEIKNPQSSVEGVIPANFSFRPLKVAVDRAETIYVIAEGVYDGLLTFDKSGRFMGYIGAPNVTPSVFDRVWSRLATDEQRNRMALFLPTEHSNLDVGENGFIYATVSDGAIRYSQAIRMLSPSGKDVLRRQGFQFPVGDVVYPYWGASVVGPSLLVDVVAWQGGIYSALDQRRGRVFTYDDSGHLLFVFGGSGDQFGTFGQPVALEVYGGRILVLDKQKGCVVAFRPSEYATTVLLALAYYDRGLYNESERLWRIVIGQNGNYELAYTGIGRARLRQGDYTGAMANFRYANDRLGYSKALKLHREEWVAQNFGTVALIFLGVVACVAVLARLPWTRRTVSALRTKSSSLRCWLGRHRLGWVAHTADGLRYAPFVMLHPFDGFFALKHEKRGSALSATVLLALVSLTYVGMRQYTGFVFNHNDPSALNVVMEFASVLVPFTLWCAVNWALTTLMEGKGTARDIYVASAYALSPIVVINVPLTIVSHAMTLEDGALYYFMIAVAVAWALILLVIGTMVTHEYDLRKTIGTSLTTVAGMVFLLFMGMLFFSLIDRVLVLITTIYREVSLRL